MQVAFIECQWQNRHFRSAWLCSPQVVKTRKPVIPRGSERGAGVMSCSEVLNKAETGTDVPHTSIHYHKTTAKFSWKIALSWPIQHSPVIAKKSI